MRPGVVIPTFNEAANIVALLRAVRAAVPSAAILVIDDASPDGTGALADSVAAGDAGVTVLHRRGKLGLGTAYVEGFRWALDGGLDPVVQMDADFSHDPDDIPRLLAAVEHADIAVGSRRVEGGGMQGWPLRRRLLSRFGSLWAGLLGVGVRDATSGFKCFRRSALTALDLGSFRSVGFAFQIEVAHAARSAGLRVIEVPITFRQREQGASKMTAAIILEAVLIVGAMCLRRRPPAVARHRGPTAIAG